MGPPPPPKPKQTRDSTFMEKLNAVDEELAASPVCMDSFQVSMAIELREDFQVFTFCSEKAVGLVGRVVSYVGVMLLFVFDSLALC